MRGFVDLTDVPHPLEQLPGLFDFPVAAFPQLRVEPRPDMGINGLLDHGGCQHVCLPAPVAVFPHEFFAAKGHVRFTPNSDRECGLPQTVVSALPPKADSCTAAAHVR